MLTANSLTRITKVQITTVAPLVIAVSLLGAFGIRNNIGDVFLAVGFGIIGFLMMKYGMSRVAVLIALVLGPLAEQNFHRSLQISGGG